MPDWVDHVIVDEVESSPRVTTVREYTVVYTILGGTPALGVQLGIQRFTCPSTQSAKFAELQGLRINPERDHWVTGYLDRGRLDVSGNYTDYMLSVLVDQFPRGTRVLEPEKPKERRAA